MFCGEAEQPQTFISETSYVKVVFYTENYTDQVSKHLDIEQSRKIAEFFRSRTNSIHKNLVHRHILHSIHELNNKWKCICGMVNILNCIQIDGAKLFKGRNRKSTRNWNLNIFLLLKSIRLLSYANGIFRSYCEREFRDCRLQTCYVQSPAYPGLYPRALNCRYRLHTRQPFIKLYLQNEHFSVDGQRWVYCLLSIFGFCGICKCLFFWVFDTIRAETICVLSVKILGDDASNPITQELWNGWTDFEKFTLKYLKDYLFWSKYLKNMKKWR